jgi:glycosyltransferase involved in cell wall biosynthesis
MIGNARDRVRVALVSVGIGRVQRGFERYFTDLYGVLRDDLDVVLYKSAGLRSRRERIPPLLRLLTALTRALRLGSAEYQRDCLAFGLGMRLDLLRDAFDVVHVIDPPLAFTLQRLGRLAPSRCRLLFTEGSVMPPARYPRVDHIHHVAQATFDAALAAGVPEGHMTMVPCGLHTDRFSRPQSRRELRQKYGVGERTFVALAVSAVKRDHKRVDHIIEEVARLEGDVLLWLDGNPEDPAIPELARERLGNRCRITHVPSSDVPELFQLADVMVHASLSESFGLAIVEALCSETMVLAHDSPHFEWLVGDRDCLVDMRTPGRLAARLRELAGGEASAEQPLRERARRTRSRFDWASLAPAYLEMYRDTAAAARRPEAS